MSDLTLSVVAIVVAVLTIGCSQSETNKLSSRTVRELADEREAIAREIAQAFDSAAPEEFERLNQRSDELLVELQRRWPSQSKEFINVALTTDDPTLIAVLIRIASKAGHSDELRSLVDAGLLRKSSSVQGGDVSIRILAQAGGEYLSTSHGSLPDDEIVAFMRQLFSANELYRDHTNDILGHLPADKESRIRSKL